MKIPLIKKIELLIKGKYPHFVNGGEAERLAFNEGYKASNAGRRCRDLVKLGKIERRIGENGSVEYRYKFQANELPPAFLPQPKKMVKLFN